MRKCHILNELGQLEEVEKIIIVLEQLAFQSEKSHVYYKEIKKIKERME